MAPYRFLVDIVKVLGIHALKGASVGEPLVGVPPFGKQGGGFRVAGGGWRDPDTNNQANVRERGGQGEARNAHTRMQKMTARARQCAMHISSCVIIGAAHPNLFARALYVFFTSAADEPYLRPRVS